MPLPYFRRMAEKQSPSPITSENPSLDEMLQSWANQLHGGDVSELAEKHGVDNTFELIEWIEEGRKIDPGEKDVDKLITLGKGRNEAWKSPRSHLDVDQEDLSQLEIDSLYEQRLEKIPKPVWTDFVHTSARNHDQQEDDLTGRFSCGSAVTGPYQDFVMSYGQRIFNVEIMLGQILFTLFPFLATIRTRLQVPPQEQVFQSAYKRLRGELYVDESDSDDPGTRKRVHSECSPQPRKIRKSTKSRTKRICDQDGNTVGYSECHHPVWKYNPTVGFPSWLCPPCRGKSRTLWFQSTDVKHFMANEINDKEGLTNVICCRCKTVSKKTKLLAQTEKDHLPVWYCGSCLTGRQQLSKQELTFEKLTAVSLNLICCASCGRGNFCPGKLDKVERDNLPFWLCSGCHISEVAKSTRKTLAECRKAVCEQLMVETQLREKCHMREVFRKRKEIEMEYTRNSNTAYTDALCDANKNLFCAPPGLFRIECRFCGGTGHNSSTCFHLTQYAEKLVRKEGRTFCSLCMRKDHTASQCWYEKIESDTLTKILNRDGIGFVADLQSSRQHVHSHMSVLLNELLKTLPHSTERFPEPVDNEYRMTQVIASVIKDSKNSPQSPISPLSTPKLPESLTSAPLLIPPPEQIPTTSEPAKVPDKVAPITSDEMSHEVDGPEDPDPTSEDTFLVLDSYSAGASPDPPITTGGTAQEEPTSSDKQQAKPQSNLDGESQQPDFSQQLKALVGKMKGYNSAFSTVCDQLEKQVPLIDTASKSVSDSTS